MLVPRSANLRRKTLSMHFEEEVAAVDVVDVAAKNRAVSLLPLTSRWMREAIH